MTKSFEAWVWNRNSCSQFPHPIHIARSFKLNFFFQKDDEWQQCTCDMFYKFYDIQRLFNVLQCHRHLTKNASFPSCWHLHENTYINTVWSTYVLYNTTYNAKGNSFPFQKKYLFRVKPDCAAIAIKSFHLCSCSQTKFRIRIPLRCQFWPCLTLFLLGKQFTNTFARKTQIVIQFMALKLNRHYMGRVVKKRIGKLRLR